MEKTLEDATYLHNDLDLDLFNKHFIETWYSYGKWSVVIIDAFPEESPILSQTQNLLSSLGERLGLHVNIEDTIRVPQSQSFELENYRGRLDIKKIQETIDAIIVLAPAGESFLTREPLIRSGISRSKFQSLFREVL